MLKMQSNPKLRSSVTDFVETGNTPTAEVGNQHLQLNGASMPIRDQAVDDVLTLTTGTQHSIVTIFCLWNALMGTSLLAMPWAIKQAGFANGIVLLIIMAGIMAYTSYMVLTSGRHIKDTVVSEFSDVVRFYLGRAAETVALFCGLIYFLGVCIVYWILLSTSLYHIVIFIYDNIHGTTTNLTVTNAYSDAVCELYRDTPRDHPETFQNVWDETNTVPLFVAILIFPLTNIKSPTFFIKLTALGILSVSYLIIFVLVKASKWGFHLNFENTSSPEFTENFKTSFPALTGIAAMAYFIHNAFMTTMRHQKHPENNTRDLTLAFGLVCATYVFMGAAFYATFPLDKSCIQDNLLENMISDDTMSFVARIGLFLQMTSILPFNIYVMRTQIMQFLFSDVWPSLIHVMIVNTIIVTICILFAVFLSQIGHIISFTGAFCGFSYAIVSPCLVYLVSGYQRGTLTILKVSFHFLLIAIGGINFIAQFIIVGQTS